MKTLKKIILTSLIGAGSFGLIEKGYGQNTLNSKIDSIYNIIKTQRADSTSAILEDRNKDKIIDKIIYVNYYPNKICLAISVLDADYDGVFETTTKRLSENNYLLDAGEFEENLDDVFQILKNEPEGKYRIK